MAYPLIEKERRSERLPGQPRTLSVPHAESVRYARNFIKTAVCELRFPTLLELEEKQPVKLQSQLRKKYPQYKRVKTVDVSEGGSTPADTRYLFATVDKKWLVTLKSFSIGLETEAYTQFSDFYERLGHVLDASKDIIDTDFFTRVGLRYINELPIDNIDSFAQWINPDLATALANGVFGTASHFLTEVRGSTDVGRYSFRHGIKEKEDKYTLDFDFFEENVKFDETLELLKRFNALNFAFFHYCLGPRAFEYLGEPKTKKRMR